MNRLDACSIPNNPDIIPNEPESIDCLDLEVINACSLAYKYRDGYSLISDSIKNEMKRANVRSVRVLWISNDWTHNGTS